jgi:hypothetical protein
MQNASCPPQITFHPGEPRCPRIRKSKNIKGGRGQGGLARRKLNCSWKVSVEIGKADRIRWATRTRRQLDRLKCLAFRFEFWPGSLSGAASVDAQGEQPQVGKEKQELMVLKGCL